MMLTIIYIVMLVAGLAVLVPRPSGDCPARSAPGSQSRPDASSVKVLRLVPLAIGTGAAVFGVVGLVISRWTDMAPGRGVIWSLGAGLLVGFVVQAVLYYRVLRRTAAQPLPPDPALGLTADVVITIPGNGIGQIAYDSQGQTLQIGASSATFETLPAGSVVVIEKITRRIALVRPIS